MKIAHINILPAYSIGVFSKLKAQADAAQKASIPMDFYLLNPLHEEKIHNLHIIKKSYHFLPGHFLKTLAFKLFKFKNLEKLIPLDNYDAIILRYPLVDGFYNHYFIKKYGHKLFSEHHTDEIFELKSMGRVLDLVRRIIEEKFSNLFLRGVRGVIGVTEEIVRNELKKSGKKPFAVISNGISTSSIPATSFVPFDGKILKLIFVASAFEPWHGLERLIKSISAYDNDTCIELTLVGRLRFSQHQLLLNINAKDTVTVKEVGYVHGEDLNQLFSTSNLAIASLGLYKNYMRQACPLKTREYIARGIPFIYAYDDADLKKNEIFALHFPNDESILDFNKIFTFAKTVSIDPHPLAQHMNAFAKEKLDWEIKVREMYNFVSNIMNFKRDV